MPSTSERQNSFPVCPKEGTDTRPCVRDALSAGAAVARTGGACTILHDPAPRDSQTTGELHTMASRKQIAMHVSGDCRLSGFISALSRCASSLVDFQDRPHTSPPQWFGFTRDAAGGVETKSY